MQFRYDTRLTAYGFEQVPRVPVMFSNPKNGLEIPVFGLVDSGASDTLLHWEIGAALGIDIESGKKHEYAGVGGIVTGYRHPIKIRLVDDRREFLIECAILKLPSFDGLLGQRGFFDNYKVTFEKYKKTFDLIARK